MLIHDSETERNAKHSVHLKTLSENHVIKNNGGDEARLKWARHSLCTADSPYPGRQRRGKICDRRRREQSGGSRSMLPRKY